jgi:hypothetical protein
MKTNIFNLVKILVAANFLTACVAIQPFPHTVRAGDTVTLAIGSLDGVTRTNTTVNYYPDSDPGNPIDISSNIRSALKVFADKTSRSYWDTQSGLGLDTIDFMETLSGHAGWQSVLVVDMPTTLPPGTGYIKITPGAGVVYPLTQTKVGDVDISMEILDALPGSGHDFEYRKLAYNTDTSIGDLAMLEPLRQVIVRNIAGTSSYYNNIAAAEFDLFVPVVDQSLVDVSNQVGNNDIAVILDDQTQLVRGQANLSWSRTGSNMKVIITSATGELPPNQIRFSIVVSNLTLESSNGWRLGVGASITAQNYYDINGNPASGPTPDITVQQ